MGEAKANIAMQMCAFQKIFTRLRECKMLRFDKLWNQRIKLAALKITTKRRTRKMPSREIVREACDLNREGELVTTRRQR